jgi:hypothetical protein
MSKAGATAPTIPLNLDEPNGFIQARMTPVSVEQASAALATRIMLFAAITIRESSPT